MIYAKALLLPSWRLWWLADPAESAVDIPFETYPYVVHEVTKPCQDM